MSAPITAVVFGAGGRGNRLASYALDYPDQLKIVAVAEPIRANREHFATRYGLDSHRCYASWDDLMNDRRLADVVINATMDRMHYESTMAALSAGYDVLLEKPMSPILAENVRLVQHAEAQSRLLQICHVLRYTTFFQTLYHVINSGTLGRIISLDHRENLAYWHMAHSFVRGNWRNSELSSPMILAKCCHDFDILLWLLRRKVVRLSSFGALTLFRSENAPHPEVPERCTDGCPVAETCKYDARRIYLSPEFPGWLNGTFANIPNAQDRFAALAASPLGRCVYRCDNDVVDHQSVNMEFEDDITATLIMNGQGYQEGRTLRIDGTKATLTGSFTEPGYQLNIHHHQSGAKEVVPTSQADDSGHGGGDTGIVRSFINAMRGVPDLHLTTARESLESHLLAFAAEESRLAHTVIDMATYRRYSESTGENIGRSQAR